MLLSVFLSFLQCALKMYQKWCGWLMVVFPMVQFHLYPDQNRCPLLYKIWSIPFQKSHAFSFQKSHHTPFQNLVIFPFKNLVHPPFKNPIIPLSKIWSSFPSKIWCILFKIQSSFSSKKVQHNQNPSSVPPKSAKKSFLLYLLPPCNRRDPSICGLSRSFTCVLATYHPCMVISSFLFFTGFFPSLFIWL